MKTCEFCGKPLRPNYERELIEAKFAKGFMINKGKVTKTTGFGYSDNGFFCSLRCGFNYAVRLLKNKRAS